MLVFSSNLNISNFFVIIIVSIMKNIIYLSDLNHYLSNTTRIVHLQRRLTGRDRAVYI
jgi:hypothetical protein